MLVKKDQSICGVNNSERCELESLCPRLAVDDSLVDSAAEANDELVVDSTDNLSVDRVEVRNSIDLRVFRESDDAWNSEIVDSSLSLGVIGRFCVSSFDGFIVFLGVGSNEASRECKENEEFVHFVIFFFC